jgi:hypothetical protein
LKLLRTIRLDSSDTFVFERAASPGEWAVPGSFMFWNEDVPALQGKARAAFRGGFLGAETLGWSTLVQIVEATERDYAECVAQLARQIHEKFGAPSFEEAKRAAEEEFAFARSLCTQPLDTLIAIHRIQEDGEIKESFRSLRPKDGPNKPFRAFSFPEVVGDENEDAGEKVDLVAMGRGHSELK